MMKWSIVRSALVAVIIYALVATGISLAFFHRASWDATSETISGVIVFAITLLLTSYFDRKNAGLA